MPLYTPPPQPPGMPPTAVRPVHQLPPRNPGGVVPDPGNMGSLEYAQQVQAAPGQSGEAYQKQMVRANAAPAAAPMQAQPRPTIRQIIDKVKQRVSGGAAPAAPLTPGAKAIIDARMQTKRG